MKYIYHSLFYLLSFILFGCSTNYEKYSKVGDVTIKIDIQKENLYTSSLSIVNTDQFNVRIENIHNRQETILFKRVQDIPSRLRLKQGQYEVIASSVNYRGDLVFLGKQQLTVIDGNATMVEVNCKMISKDKNQILSAVEHEDVYPVVYK